MPRKPQPWFRFYVEAFSDRKILRLPASRRWLWVAILGAARESPEPGKLFIAKGEPMTIKELARYADVSMRDATEGLAQMRNLGMIRGDDPIEVINWDQRQFESDNVTVRTTAYRERSQERSKERSNDVPINVHGNVPRAHMTETETETENPPPPSGAPPPRGTPRRRGERLPDGWRPDPTIRAEYTIKFPTVDIQLETDKFKDYWKAKAGKDATKLDWQATWRNWIRRASEHRPSNNGQSQTGDIDWQAAAKRAQERDSTQ